MTETPYWHSLLPRLGSAAEFAAAREVFASSGFDYASVCRRVGAEHLYLLTTKLEGEYLAKSAVDALDALIRLFVIGRTMEAGAVPAVLEPLKPLGLLLPHPENPGAWFAPVMAHPTPGGVVMICDRNSSPEGVPIKRAPADALYPALFANTLDFVERFPNTPCDSILEIGTGTGTAAIQWAKLAREVWATDITSRSVHFAEFNRRLAGVENIHVVEGDMYAPVEGKTFDRIAAHPPFVPARNSAVIFRDGGEDGEQLVRRVIEGLPVYLRPGGLFWASFMISDRVGEMAEGRIRSWLAPCDAEFDIALAIDSRNTASQTIAHSVLNGVGTVEEIHYFGELWRQNRTEYLIHASVLIRRRAQGSAERPAVTVRTQAGKGFGAGHLDWLLDWNAAQFRPGFEESFLESRPALAPACEVRATHRLERGAVVSEEFTFEADGPIRVACRVPVFMAGILTQCDGGRSVREMFEGLRGAGKIPTDADPREFLRMLSGLVSAGVLTPGPSSSL
jgi:SAM-dependent methyltransferase